MIKKQNITILFFISIAFLLFNCKEDAGNIGLNMQPVDEFLNTDFMDTSTIAAYTTAEDSIVTKYLITNILGYVKDPIFGTSKGDIYLQFKLPTANISFGNDAVADSLVLSVAYTSYYGDTTQAFMAQVFEIDEVVDKEKVYYSNSTLSTDATPLCSPYQFLPRPKSIEEGKNYAYVRIPLNINFANTKFLQASDANLTDNETFQHYFKGLSIKAVGYNGDGSAVSAMLSDSLTCLTLYYHNNSDPSTPLSIQFISDDTSAVRFGTVEHDFTLASSDLQAQLSGNQSSTKDNLFVQSGAGVKTVLNFPYLRETFAGKKVVIHRAILVISEDEAKSEDRFFPPSSLNMRYFNPSDNIYHYMPDYLLSTTYFNGSYNSEKKEYRAFITQYIQNLVDGKGEDYKVEIFIPAAGTYLCRLALCGTAPTVAGKRLRLEINYTIIE
ncbi:MAG: DUF4270 domain-containing protein [Bacteroidales bacterium]|jgi:hypothetical protein|nr:DUF4270 domain-containing protein [Bacteroidales bacterium]